MRAVYGTPSAMRFVLPGGSGQVGHLLARAFHADGHEVVVLARRRPAASAGASSPGTARRSGRWAAEIDGADVVINLAGRSVNCRYNAANRAADHGLARRAPRAPSARPSPRAARPPRVWLQASTATIYAHRFDAPNDEATGILGGAEPDAPDTWRFSIDVATAWEQRARRGGRRRGRARSRCARR